MKKWLLIGVTFVFLITMIFSMINPGISTQVKADGQEETSIETVKAVPVVSREEIRTGLLDVIGAYEPGTAGSSLKRAAAAVKVLDFAETNRISQVEKEKFSEELKLAWQGMTDREKQNFPEQFSAIAELADDALQDFSSHIGLFEDAGILEKMQQLLQNEDLIENWESLKECTETIKGS